MYTRKGDTGETSLYGPRRVPKDDPRVEAYGTIDELNSMIGMVIAGSRDRSLNSSLKEVQRLLFVAGGDAAADMRGASKVPRISDADTKRVEEMTDKVLSNLPGLRNFILPGGTQTGATLQLARAVCRRAERRLLTASKSSEMNHALIPFFNRLSSYLFNLARYVNEKAGKKEEIWRS